jgi:hypothetical protein
MGMGFTRCGFAGAMVLIVVLSSAAHSADTRWIDATSGDWDDASRWSNGVPGSTDRAIIDAEGAAYTIDLSYGLSEIQQLVMDSPDATLDIGTSGRLDIADLAEIRDGVVFLGSGQIRGPGHWIVEPAAVFRSQNSLIIGTTIFGEVEVAGHIELYQSTLAGRMIGGGNLELYHEDGEERVIDYDIDGTVIIRPSTPSIVDTVPTLRVAESAFIRMGETGGLRETTSGDRKVHFINEGTLWFDATDFTPGGRPTMRVESFTNHGFILLDNGAEMEFQGRLVNTGLVFINEGEASFEGGTTAELGEIDNRGLITLIGLDNTDDEFVLEDGGGSWTLEGDFVGGRLVVGDDVSFASDASFTDVVIDAAPDLFARANGSPRLGDGVVMTRGPIEFSLELTLGGSHMIPGIYGDEEARWIYLDPGYTLTSDVRLEREDAWIHLGGTENAFAEGVTVSGARLIIGTSGVFTNRGILEAGMGDEVFLSGRNLTSINQGLINPMPGGRVVIERCRFRNEGTIRIDLDGRFNWGTNDGVVVTPESLGLVENSGEFTLYAPFEIPSDRSFEIDTGSWAFRSITGGTSFEVGEDAELAMWWDSTFSVPVRCKGEMSIGSRDSITIDGDLELLSTSVLTLAVPNTTDPEYFGTIDISGTTTLGGKLVIDATEFGGWMPDFGTAHVIRSDGPIVGDFSSIELLSTMPMHALFDAPTGMLTIESGCAPADIGHPLGLLDLADITAFVTGLPAQDPRTDLNRDGAWDLTDITAFIESFFFGCS